MSFYNLIIIFLLLMVSKVQENLLWWILYQLIFSENVLTLRYNCLETTILDDMLLNFLKHSGIIQIKVKSFRRELKTENFTQKIDSYFHAIVKPVVIILNSYDVILKNNTQEIDNFIKHLLKLSNVKLLLHQERLLQKILKI